MEYRRYQPPCSRFIASDNTQSKCVKCMGFSHTREAVFGVSKCKICRNLHLKPFHSRLEVFERESFIFPCHAPEVSAAFRESATWGSVAAERDLWINLTEIREKEKVFLFDAPSLNLGCLEAVNSVVEKFRSAKEAVYA